MAAGMLLLAEVYHCVCAALAPSPFLTCEAAVDLHLCLLFGEALEARVGVHLRKPRVRLLLAAAATGPAGSSSSSFLLLLFRHVVRAWAGADSYANIIF